MPLARTLETFAAAVAANDGKALAALFTQDGVYDDYFFPITHDPQPVSGDDKASAMFAPR